MVVFSLGSIWKTSQLAKVITTGETVKAIMVFGKMGSFMDKESRRCQTVQYSAATGLKELLKDMGHARILMEVNTLESFLMAVLMVKEKKFLLMDQSTKENGSKVKQRAMGQRH